MARHFFEPGDVILGVVVLDRCQLGGSQRVCEMELKILQRRRSRFWQNVAGVPDKVFDRVRGFAMRRFLGLLKKQLAQRVPAVVHLEGHRRSSSSRNVR
ncbi:hypothetical protein D3C71_1533120 [compost metagenome]